MGLTTTVKEQMQYSPSVRTQRPLDINSTWNPKNLVYLPVSARTISRVNFRITDQSICLISFNEEIISIRIHLQEVPYLQNN